MFLIHSNTDGAVAPWEYLPASAGTYQVGQALNVSGGRLVPLTQTSTTTPSYICMANTTAANDASVPVTRIDKNTVYETILTKVAESAKIGSKLQVSAGGFGVDAEADGSFEIRDLEGTDADCVVRGRFL